MALPNAIFNNSGVDPELVPQAAPAGDPVLAAILAHLGQQGQPQAQQPNQMGALIQALNAPRGHHYGIGGAEITPDNPMGNTGGDPFSNGFFSHSPMPQPTNVLVGSPHPNPLQLGLLQASKAAQMTPGIPLPPGDPQARAFWSGLGQGAGGSAPNFATAQRRPQSPFGLF